MEKPSKGNIGNTGEYYFASILSSLDFITTITLGRAEKFDILAASPKNRVFKFSIKTAWELKKHFPLSIKDEIGGHEDFFYVFITLNKMESEPNYWVVPSIRVNKILKDVNNIYFNKPGKKGQKLNDVGLRKFNFQIDKWIEKNYPELTQEELSSYLKNLKQLF